MLFWFLSNGSKDCKNQELATEYYGKYKKVVYICKRRDSLKGKKDGI